MMATLAFNELSSCQLMIATYLYNKRIPIFLEAYNYSKILIHSFLFRPELIYQRVKNQNSRLI